MKNDNFSMNSKSHIYLIPSLLDENGTDSLPAYLMTCVRKCQVIFAENERTVRRFLKKMDKTIEIDSFEWHSILKESNEHEISFTRCLQEHKHMAIISEAGCPGIADPGQSLVRIAQERHAVIHPLVGPVSPMLALMASGMNGQHFEFVGYLPIDQASRIKAIKELEAESAKKNSTKIFIETPYRNNQLLETILQNANHQTRLCVACNLTGEKETIISQPISWWKSKQIDLHKQPAIFLLYAGNI